MKVAIVTSTRADFGLLLPLIKKLNLDSFFDLSVIATGSHFDKKRGETLQEIFDEDITHLMSVNIDISDTTDFGISKSAAMTLGSFSEKLYTLKPELLIVLGDRYEILSVVFAAFLLKIPIAHISGGDITSGALDDSIRHSISKLSHIHFPTTERYRQRLIQLGEQPKTVFNVGNLCIDNIKTIKQLSQNDIERFLNFDLKKYEKNILVTLHPETTSLNQSFLNDEFFHALSSLHDIGIIITYPNHDSGSDQIIAKISELKASKLESVCVCRSLGMRRYHSMLSIVDLVVGNSSSGITEVPSYKIPTVNVGNRQHGRIKAESVLNVDYESKNIQAAILKALDLDFQKLSKKTINPYGDGHSSDKIIRILKKVELKTLISKEFFDG